MMKKIINSVFIVIMILTINAFADNSLSNSEIIYPQDNKCIMKKDFNFEKQKNYEFAMLPLRSALEAIGAEVVWNGEERSISISYNGEDYIATLDYIDGVEVNTIDICKSKYKDYKIMDLSIQLSSWGGGSFYEIIDDSTYMDDFAMIRLFYYLGYYISINSDNNTFNIVPVNEESDNLYKEWYDEEFLILNGLDTEEEGITLEVWCCNEYYSNYNVFNVISYSSKRLPTDDLEVQFEFTYKDKELEQELGNKDVWEETNDNEILARFNGKKLYKRIRKENLLYDYYVIECEKYYVGYSVVPKSFLMNTQ